MVIRAAVRAAVLVTESIRSPRGCPALLPQRGPATGAPRLERSGASLAQTRRALVKRRSTVSRPEVGRASANRSNPTRPLKTIYP